MSLAGAMGGHTVVSKLLLAFGTKEQQDKYLPRMATGEVRATMALTEPGGGSDLQAMMTVARRADNSKLPPARPGSADSGKGDHPDGGGGSGARSHNAYVINGAKTWISNARRSALIALLCKTDPDARPRHKGISILLVEHGPGLTVSRDLPKLGYKGVESCELVFDGYRAPAAALLGGVEGEGFAQMMKGLETGRIQVASRALGVANAAAAVRHGGGHGQAFRLGGRDAGGPGRGADPRRVRVLRAVRRGAILPGRAADDRRGGHQRDTAERDREPAC